MAEKKDKKTKNLDDIFDDLAKEHSVSIEAGLKAHDEHSKDEVQFKYLHGMFAPAHNDLYQITASELDKAFAGEKGDDTKIAQKHHTAVKKAVTEGLKKYFEKVQPSVLEAIKGMEEEEAYDHLVSMYDAHIGNGEIEGSTPLRKSIDSLLRGKRKIGDLKTTLYESGSLNSKAAITVLNSKYIQHHLGPHQHRMHGYIRQELEKKGMEIKPEHQSTFYQAGLSELLKMRHMYVEGKAHQLLQKKEEKKH